MSKRPAPSNGYEQPSKHGCGGQRAAESTTASDSDNSEESDSVLIAVLEAKVMELVDVMKQHNLSGYGNVLKAKDALLALPDVVKRGRVTLADQEALLRCGFKGMPKGKPVYSWISEIIRCHDCAYIEHIKATRNLDGTKKGA